MDTELYSKDIDWDEEIDEEDAWWVERRIAVLFF